MENNSTLNEKISGRSLTRREWVQRMLAGAGVAAPAVAVARSARTHAGTDAAPAAIRVEAAASEWKPGFFSDYQNQLLVVLAEKIVPGSTGVQANQFLDAAMGAETQGVQQKFVSSLNAMEGESLRRFTKPFNELSSEQQDEVLTAASTAAASGAEVAEEAAEAEAGKHSSAPNLRDYFDFLKGWISTAYYSSEAGMKELGWTGENFFTSFPGCQHPGGHS